MQVNGKTRDESIEEKLNASLNGETSDPVFACDEGWFFFEETWNDEHGPFASEAAARAALKDYAATL